MSDRKKSHEAVAPAVAEEPPPRVEVRHQIANGLAAASNLKIKKQDLFKKASDAISKLL
jgi:hypothetical protein